MDSIWFEETLSASEEDVEATVKGSPDSYELSESILARTQQSARCIVRVQNPRWRELEANEKPPLASTKTPGRFYFIRLGFEFDIPADGKRDNVRFVGAVCRAYIWSQDNSQSQPTVYDIFPHALQEGEQRKISVELKPEIKVKDVAEVSLGSISTDFAVGIVEPACVGFTGKDEREPRWELTPKSKALLGIRHFWLVVEMPQGCESIRLAVRTEAKAQGYFGLLPLRGKYTSREHLPSIVLPTP